MMFQLMFAILTPALISGAFAERMRFSAFLILSFYGQRLFTILSLIGMGRRRVAKGTWCTRLRWRKRRSHHFRSCWSCISYFPRKTKNINGSSPHHLPFTMLGAGLLWFGWFGFNVGSALSLNDVALTAFINTNIAAAASALTWMLSEWFFQSKPTAMGAACGAVSGLVAITPACGFVTPFSALLIGAIGGVLCFGAVFS